MDHMLMFVIVEPQLMMNLIEVVILSSMSINIMILIDLQTSQPEVAHEVLESLKCNF